MVNKKRMGPIIGIVVAIVILVGIFLIITTAQREDFTSNNWTRLKTTNDLTVTPHTVSFAGPLNGDGLSGDYGIDFFGSNLKHQFDFFIENSSEGSFMILWHIMNNPTGQNGVGDEPHVSWDWAENKAGITLTDFNRNFQEHIPLEAGKRYRVDIEKNGKEMKVRVTEMIIFGFGIDRGVMEATLVNDRSYRYLFMPLPISGQVIGDVGNLVME